MEKESKGWIVVAIVIGLIITLLYLITSKKKPDDPYEPPTDENYVYMTLYGENKVYINFYHQGLGYITNTLLDIEHIRDIWWAMWDSAGIINETQYNDGILQIEALGI